MREKLIVTRNFLYRLFIISFIINIIAQIILTLATKSNNINQVSLMLGVTPFYLAQLIFTSIVIIRVFLFYFILLPAIALHWTIASDKHIC